MKIGGSLASVSRVVSRRGASSISTTVSPFLPLIVTGTISSGSRPSSVALIASWCERSAQRSRSGRVSSSSAATSLASCAMCLPLNGFVRPSLIISSIALPSPMRKPNRASLSRYGDFDIDSIPPASPTSRSPDPDRVVEQAGRADARRAHLVDRLRGDLLGDPALDLGLPGGDLALPGLEDLAHHDVLDLVGRDVGALERGLDRGAAELGGVDGWTGRRRACRSACGRLRGSRSWASGLSSGGGRHRQS